MNDVISWLKYSKILGGCDLYNQGNVNALLNERRFYFMDCGISSYVARTTPIDNGTVAGILAENFVYTEIYRLYKKHGLKGNKPCCSIYNNYELDFMLVDMSDKRYGVEVKSKRSNKTESSKCLIMAFYRTQARCPQKLQSFMPKQNLKNIVSSRTDCSCLTLIGICWNWRKTQRNKVQIPG